MSVPWAELSRHPHKAQLYGEEGFVERAWVDYRRQWGEDAAPVLRRLAVVVLKPEAIVRRAGSTVIEYLNAHGLTPIAWRELALDAETCRTIWRYQWNKASEDRVRLHILVASLTPWFLILLRDDAPAPGVPASVRLWGLKGQTDERRRDPGHLRSVIGMRNRMLGFVHTPDEPADIVREQGILLSAAERRAWLHEVGAGLGRDRGKEAVAALAAVEEELPRHSVDAEEVVDRLTLTASSPQVDPSTRWDYAVLAAELIEHDRPGVSAIIDAGDFQETERAWARRIGGA
ncbi:MAG: nucleoside-diphosphate kinase [Solirubrobacterales bacterium]